MAATRGAARDLVPWRGRLDPTLCSGAVAGMGSHAAPLRALTDLGFVPPDVLMGMTLWLLGRQPRRPREDGEIAAPIEGGVWVREQMTVHAPVRLDDELSLTGQALPGFQRRGRRYGVTRCETRDAGGRLLVSNCTTGLLAYRRDAARGDAGEAPGGGGVAPMDLAAATRNPARERLRTLGVGTRVEGAPATIDLELMRLRDAGRQDNRIHTDPEVARRAGLAAPIAGGSHVVAFALAAAMEAWGPECLLHGAQLDVRWVGQTRAGDTVRPSVQVIEATPERLGCTLAVDGRDRTLVTGALRIPLAGAA